MRITGIIREALASAWAAKVSSLLIAIVSAAMCFAALATVGQTAANQAAVQAKLEGAGARVLIVRDMSGQGFINNRTLASVARLSSVERAIALGMPFDSTNGRIGPGGTLVTTWPLHGDLAQAITLVRGRWPLPGEALITATAQARLGLAEPIGYLAWGTNQYPIVGSYVPVPGFEDFATGAVVNDNAVEAGTELRVIIDSISAAGITQSAVLGILAPADAGSVSVQSPLGLAELSQVVGTQLAGFGRNLLWLILGVGGLFVAAVVLADVLVRRRDLGRRRTLGATRGGLTALVVVRAGVCALVGVVIGVVAGWVVTARIGQAPGLDFAVAVGVLATLTAAIVAVLPAMYAARVDPVRVMRTP